MKYVFTSKLQIPFTCKLFIMYDLLIVRICYLLNFFSIQQFFLQQFVLHNNNKKKIPKRVTISPSSLGACCFTRVIGDLAGGLLSGWRQLLEVLFSPSVIQLQNKNGGEIPLSKTNYKKKKTLQFTIIYHLMLKNSCGCLPLGELVF